MIDPKHLEQAFALFNQASAQLSGTYLELQQQAARLTTELEVTNGELRRQFVEKERLSQRLKLLLDALPGAVIVLDAGGCIAEANPAALQMLGGRISGQSWGDLQEALMRSTASPQEWEYTAPDGAQRRVSMVESPLDVDGGRILLLQDVTEAWQMRQQLERHMKLSALGEMAAGLAHQLRTPLATALLYAANLDRPDLPGAERNRFAQRIVERLRHLERLIQDMLLFVRGERVASEIVPIADLLDELLQVMEPQLRDKGVQLRAHDQSHGAGVAGSRKALVGALLNLLENAVQACGADGRVDIHADVADGRLQMRVADNGVGITEATREHLFEPFFTTRSDGTGLGLAVVKSVVEAHGGEVRLEQKTGIRGTTFIVTLPAASRAQTPQHQLA
jgi:two-component system, sensor histidine kinase FlrB